MSQTAVFRPHPHESRVFRPVPLPHAGPPAQPCRDEYAVLLDRLGALSSLSWPAAMATARPWVQAVREQPAPFWAMESLLRDHPISQPEGLALMRVAEALLRVPDTATGLARPSRASLQLRHACRGRAHRRGRAPPPRVVCRCHRPHCTGRSWWRPRGERWHLDRASRTTDRTANKSRTPCGCAGTGSQRFSGNSAAAGPRDRSSANPGSRPTASIRRV